MLEKLSVTGFAVARAMTIAPGPGLTVFTGETGAGKSLIVDALAFAFGARRGREVVAAGAERATVQAELALPEGRVIIERSVGLAGRATARINGEAATVDQLQALAARLVDIHGQSEQLAILRPAVQLAVLDQFAGLSGEQGELAGVVQELRDVRRRLRAATSGARERERLLDQLMFETNEIQAAALVPGEDEALRQEQARLASAGRLLEDVEVALAALDGPAIGEAARAASDIAARDAGAGEVSAAATMLESAASDLAHALRNYREGLEEDPERLAAVGERLDLIGRLRRKYGETIEDVLAYCREGLAQLEAMGSAGESLEELRAREAKLLGEVSCRAEALSRARRAAAGALVRQIALELGELGMRAAALSVGFAVEDGPDGALVDLPDYEVVASEPRHDVGGEPLPRAFTETGVDRVEFLASFNAGEAARPLASVASGGETSRFLLALTVVLGGGAEPRLVVFDEVDEGVGGRAGGLVGAALARLAKRHQVLCVTHLPQVAAFGGRHFVVRKQTDGARTWSEVDEATGEPRVEELAAMLGAISDATRGTARELLAAAGPHPPAPSPDFAGEGEQGC